MSAFADEIERQVKAGRKEVGRTLEMLDSRVRPAARRRGRLIAAILLAAVAAFSVGMAVERRRRPRTLADRLHKVLPDAVRDLPDELASHLKGPVQRVRARVQ
jgi:hypothetical protein